MNGITNSNRAAGYLLQLFIFFPLGIHLLVLIPCWYIGVQ